MRFSDLCLSCLALASLGFAASPASAQLGLSSGQPMISGTGMVVISRPPTSVQVHVMLPGKGASLKAALAKLKERQERARDLLKELDAEADSIVFSAPTVSTSESQQRKQFEAMVVQRMQAMGREAPKGLSTPKMFSVSSTMTARWPLEGKSPEDVLLETEELKTKIVGADLAGSKEEEEASLEQAELMEEMEGMDEFSMSYSGEEQVEPGTPQFSYMAEITKEERTDATAKAYQKAQQQAEQLAKAANVKMGPLVGLYGSSSGDTDMGDMWRYQNGPLARVYSRFNEEMNTELQAMGATPEALKFSFRVSAMFRLETR